MKAQEPTRYEYGKPLKKSGDGKTDGKGNGLYSENKEFRENLDKVARGYFTGGASDDIAKANLSNDFDSLQELTGMTADQTDSYFDDLVSENFFGLGQGFLDQEKVNNIFRNRTVEFNNSTIPIGAAVSLLRTVDSDGNRKYVVSKKNGKPMLDVNPMYNETKNVTPKVLTSGPSIGSVIGKSVLGNAYPLVSNLYDQTISNK